MSEKGLGNWGEKLAAKNLIDRGLRILAMNYRTRWGELDIVAWDGRELVVVEVKTRTGDGYGSPADAVTPAKLATMKLVMLQFMAEHSLDCNVRVEVAMVGRSGEVAVIDGIDFGAG